MPFSRGHAGFEELRCPIQENECETLFLTAPEMLSVVTPKCGAGDNDGLPFVDHVGDLVSNQVQPRPSIFIRQRYTFGHFLNVGQRVQFIPFNDLAGEQLGEPLSNRRLSASADAHDDDCMDLLSGHLASPECDHQGRIWPL